MSRVFQSFPPDINCPMCGGNEDEQCILVPIDDTVDGNVEEAIPVHLGCLVDGFRFAKEVDVIYKRGVKSD